ncbi:MAG: zf-HC2 domain-containing protein [Lachnospiraceae bacterium]|nr:zf-HC2 domain-containing protein [Lachnospiraceae bacterium]
MEKWNCEIIRDLIPSYADDICSDATKRCVQEHIATCDECRQMLTAYKSRTLSGEKLEHKGLDGLVKIKKKMKLQNLICYLLLLFLVYTGIEVFIANHVNYSLFDNTTLLLVVCLVGNLLATIGFQGKSSPGKMAYLGGGVSLLLGLYLFIVFFQMVSRLLSGADKIFGMEMMNVGPFLERQLIAIFGAQLILFGYNLWAVIRQGKNCGWLLSLNITVIFLVYNYDIWMKTMDSFETLLASFLKCSFEVFAAGIVGVFANLLVSRFMDKKSC